MGTSALPTQRRTDLGRVLLALALVLAVGCHIELDLAAGAGPRSGAVTLPRALWWDAAAKAPTQIHGELRCPYQALSGAN